LLLILFLPPLPIARSTIDIVKTTMAIHLDPPELSMEWVGRVLIAYRETRTVSCHPISQKFYRNYVCLGRLLDIRTKPTDLAVEFASTA
jgi:hypothetical protein